MICLKLLKCVKILVCDDILTKTIYMHNMEIEMKPLLYALSLSLSLALSLYLSISHHQNKGDWEGERGGGGEGGSTSLLLSIKINEIESEREGGEGGNVEMYSTTRGVDFNVLCLWRHRPGCIVGLRSRNFLRAPTDDDIWIVYFVEHASFSLYHGWIC